LANKYPYNNKRAFTNTTNNQPITFTISDTRFTLILKHLLVHCLMVWIWILVSSVVLLSVMVGQIYQVKELAVVVVSPEQEEMEDLEVFQLPTPHRLRKC
jgi:hypothetical protein